MEKYRMLSGDEIVARGATKIEVTLPEIGLKDVTPNGSWLEQKQIQSALEARKHLVEVDRIEKSGILTHANWQEDLKLAEVTQQAGGYWQFLGHHRNHRLYLRPEEALFLMEVNCLLLSYNEIIVSLQQAYSLLLSDDISIIQYKVYASLSRLGYKVFKHVSKTSDSNKTDQITPQAHEQTVMNKTTVKEKCYEHSTASNNEIDMSEIADLKAALASCDKADKTGTESKCLEGSAMDTDEQNSTELNDENKEIQESSKESAKTSIERSIMVVEEANVTIDNKEFETAQDSTDETQHTQNPMSNEETKTANENEPIVDVPENAMEIVNDTDNVLLKKSIEQPINVSGTLELDKNNSLDHSDPQQSFDALQEQVCEEKNSNKSKLQKSSLGQSDTMTNSNLLAKYYMWKLNKLKVRQSMDHPTLDIHKSFKDCPDALENQVITINTPKEEYLPKNVFMNNLHYVINIVNVRTKNVKPTTSSDVSYSLSDEVNGAHIRRVTSTSTQVQSPIRSQTQTQQNSDFPLFFPPFRSHVPLRHYNYWRPRHNMSYFQFNLFFQRPHMSNFHPRFPFFPRMHMPVFPRHYNSPMHFNVNNEFDNLPNSTRKRPKNDAKTIHLENLKNLAQRLKTLVSTGSNRPQNTEAIQNLINTYNARFRTRLRLSDQYEIVNDDTILDTISLDDEEEESKAKKPRLNVQPDVFVENLNKLRQTALKLKKLESENKSTPRHRRALSGVVKTFNKYFNADIYINSSFDIIDRRFINLDSGSDSDCVIEEMPKVKKGKMLRNPFNILKKLFEKQVAPSSPTTSRQEVPECSKVVNSLNSEEIIKKYFKKPWVPGDSDFGRPEVISRDTMTARFVETKKEELLFHFLKDQTHKFKNWIDIKIAFLESIEETNALLHTKAMLETNVDLKSLVKPDDCSDMANVLKKLGIIGKNKKIHEESILTIDYDVYNRDIKNFKKASRPKPHFRIVCIDESSTKLSAIDVATLHSKIEDDVSILFAIVGTSSISFVQLNPVDLPVYLPCNDLG